MDNQNFTLAPFVFPDYIDELSVWEIACHQSGQNPVSALADKKTTVVLWLLLEDFQEKKLKFSMRLISSDGFSTRHSVINDVSQIALAIKHCSETGQLNTLFRRLMVKREDWLSYIDWQPKPAKMMGEA